MVNQFYRQRIIGDFIVDFYCPRSRLVIEVDGGQHSSPRMACKDGARDQCLKSRGLTVLMLDDREGLTNIEGLTGVVYENIGGKDENPP